MQRDHRVKWAGGLTFVGTGGSGHSVVLDSDKQVGLSPMELLLLGAGCCACVDLVMILKKARQQVVDAWVDIGGDRRDENPRYYTDIEMHFVVRGTDIAEHHVKRAIDLAMEKYCSASAQLAALAEIRTSYTIEEARSPD
jgi:putative redox protein